MVYGVRRVQRGKGTTFNSEVSVIGNLHVIKNFWSYSETQKIVLLFAGPTAVVHLDDSRGIVVSCDHPDFIEQNTDNVLYSLTLQPQPDGKLRVAALSYWDGYNDRVVKEYGSEYVV